MPDPAPAVSAPSGPALRARGRRPLSRVVAYTWSRQWPAEALMGVCAGVVNLAAFALQRSMGAPGWTSPALVLLGQGLWMLAPAWPLLLARTRHQDTFVWIGLLSRGPLLLVALASVTALPGGGGAGVGDWGLLFAAYLVSNNLDAVYTPHRNALIRANYPLTSRGRIYGLVTLVTGLASIAASQAAGVVLDVDPTAVRWVFPIAGVVGLAAHLLLARIRWRRETARGAVAPRPRLGSALREGGRAALRTLREDRAFRDYEVGFMLYGMGLLSATPLILTRFARDSGFSTADWARADRLVLPATQLALVWLVGRLSDTIGVVRVAALSFGLLVPFFVLVSFVATPAQLVSTYVVYGVAMAGVNVSWALGPLQFAPPGQAHHYSSVHVACVGVRSVLAPAVGYAVGSAFSYRAAVNVAAGFETLAAAWTWRLSRRVRVAA